MWTFLLCAAALFLLVIAVDEHMSKERAVAMAIKLVEEFRAKHEAKEEEWKTTEYKMEMEIERLNEEVGRLGGQIYSLEHGMAPGLYEIIYGGDRQDRQSPPRN